MNNRSLKPQSEPPKRKSNLSLVSFSNPRFVNIADRKLEEIRLLLDQGRAKEAQQLIAALLKPNKTNRISESLAAKARCALSLSLEMQGRYRESLEAVSQYESNEAREGLDAEALACVRVHLGLAYQYTGDHPKAVAILNTALREAMDNQSETQIGNVYVALARVYRSINEYTIARGHASKALDHFRPTGDWRGMAEAYFGLALANVFEGQWEAGLENLEQARSLIGERPATYLLGKIHTNMAGACWFLKRPQEGIGYLEKAVGYYDHTEHKANAMDGYNNLGETLMLVGEWDRAQTALECALALANEIDKRPAAVAAVLDSLGKLQMLRGNLSEAQSLLEQAVSTATNHGNKWYEGQAIRTLSQCLLANGEVSLALEKAQQALALGEKIGDRQAICESRLLLGESLLRAGQWENCAAELQIVLEETKDSPDDLSIAGNAHRLQGMLAVTQEDYARAVNYFGRCISMFELLGDVYRSARAHYWQGRAYAQTQPERAQEQLQQAIVTFQKLGARLALAEAEEALTALNQTPAVRQEEIAALIQLLTLRLSEATASRELLLRELAAVIREETPVQRLLILAPSVNASQKVVVLSGWTEEESRELLDVWQQSADEDEQELAARKRELTMIPLRPTKAAPATILISPRGSARLPFGLSLESLLRVVELGLNTCALNEKVAEGSELQVASATAKQSLLPGFIHSSPAMMRLVDEIYKIRSSDVTALVTGESGTGKELVARAIHAHSSRRSKVFVPFNCTAVPKELSDAFLFGYKRGAFTGAVADSAGVIRAAAGGTLFLDEVGDLPLEIQPKLLRFLQEGEIQPLGEQRPIKVDVRVIAATNSDLEEMVAAGRFREDLYYRLNVIRLQVPPLRERRSEVPAIANYYIQHYSEKFGRRDIQISPQALDLLMVYDWPGNVRQLTNEIQRIIARTEDGNLISPELLSPELRRNNAFASASPSLTIGSALPPQFWENLTMNDAVEQFKQYVLSETLRKNGGNVSRTARELGMTRRGLQLMLVRYRLSSSG
ncbi:MAG: sigma 54-interacting transcriptional regulator [Acidobacteria bacterium]|nr:sigma 54-interacting transcriptional regulator [Acidobacteriota bacterium]